MFELSIASSLIVYHHFPHENRNWGCNIPHPRRISNVCVSLEKCSNFWAQKIEVVAGTDLNAAQTAEDFGGFRSYRG